MALVAGTPVKLSASLGGEPIPLDDDTVPGKVVHLNPTPDSPDHNDMLYRLLVTNLNAATVSLYLAVTGPGITPPSTREQMRRYDIVSSEEGRGTSILPVPLILSPGYQLNISVVLPPNGTPLLLDGVAYQTTAPDTGGNIGYGGLAGTDQLGPDPIPAAPAWDDLEFNGTQTTQTKLVTLDIAQNAIAFQQAGVWQLSAGFTVTHPESSQGRSVLLRLFNLTKGSGSAGTPIGIARNQPVTTASYTILVQVEESEVGDLFQLQVQSEGSAISVTLWDNTDFSVVLVDTLAAVVDSGDLVTHEPDELVTHEPDQLIYLG